MKQLTENKAMELISSLGQMRGYPMGLPPAIKRLVDALMLNSKEPVDEAIAVKVIDGFGNDATSETQCPMPRDIREAVCSHLEEKRYDPDCAKCHGHGAFPVKRMYRGEEITEFAGCSCLARRPAPVWEKESNALPKDHVPTEFAEALGRARKGTVQ